MYALYVLYVSTIRTSYILRIPLYNLSYYSLLYSLTGSILDRAFIN